MSSVGRWVCKIEAAVKTLQQKRTALAAESPGKTNCGVRRVAGGMNPAKAANVDKLTRRKEKDEALMQLLCWRPN